MMDTGAPAQDPAAAFLSSDFHYDQLLQLLRTRAEATIHHCKGSGLFRTRAPKLYDLFLAWLPPELRQTHTCRACRHFVERYGNLVTVDEAGEVFPIFWAGGLPPNSPYARSVDQMYRRVRTGEIYEQFFHPVGSGGSLGVPCNDHWRHMHLPTELLPTACHSFDPDQQAALSIEHFGMASRALGEWTRPVVEQARDLLVSADLPRAEQFKAPLRWLWELKVGVEVRVPRVRDAWIWRECARVPDSYKHIRGSALAVLLDSIKAGDSLAAIRKRWTALVDPTKYQRPQAPPKEGNIDTAEKIIERQGFKRSLERRFAAVGDLEVLWRKDVTRGRKPPQEGTFSSLRQRAKAAEKKGHGVSLPSQVMTFARFVRELLPVTRSIHVQMPNVRGNFTGYTTASHADAPCLFKYGHHVASYTCKGGSAPAKWGMTPSAWVAVVAISRMPWEWNWCRPQMPFLGRGALLVLEGCLDTQRESLRLFPEVMVSDLHPVRSTIEAYSQQGSLDKPSRSLQYACGLTIHDRGTTTLRLELPGGSSMYVQIERMD